MKTKKFDGTDTRLVLSAMIHNQVVCSRVASQWTGQGLFDSEWANLIGKWCVQYIKKFGAPPRDKIIKRFEIWATDTVSSDEVLESIERFLQGLPAADEDESAEQYTIEVAAKLFNRVRLQNEIKEAEIDLKQGLIDDAQNRLQNLQRVNLGTGSYVEPAADPSIWVNAFEQERQKPLITYPGALGKLIGDSFSRGGLYSFMAPDKSGKTTWLLDAAYRACRSQNRVAFFDMGDSIEEEIITRLACRTLKVPPYTKVVKIPTKWPDAGLEFEAEECDGADAINGFREFKKICRKEDAFRLACYENSTLSVEGICSVLDDWARFDWRPDVVVIDYADIIAPPSGTKDVLDTIDETWKQLRRLSQSRHCLVITATQSNAAAYGKEDSLLGRSNFSGRKTKLAHVNGMLGINVSTDERRLGCSRINWIVRRKGRYSEKSYVRVAGCPDFEIPVILSRR